jgi:hypothetical protein
MLAQLECCLSQSDVKGGVFVDFLPQTALMRPLLHRDGRLRVRALLSATWLRLPMVCAYSEDVQVSPQGALYQRTITGNIAGYEPQILDHVNELSKDLPLIIRISTLSRKRFWVACDKYHATAKVGYDTGVKPSDGKIWTIQFIIQSANKPIYDL